MGQTSIGPIPYAPATLGQTSIGGIPYAPAILGQTMEYARQPMQGQPMEYDCQPTDMTKPDQTWSADEIDRIVEHVFGRKHTESADEMGCVK